LAFTGEAAEAVGTVLTAGAAPVVEVSLGTSITMDVAGDSTADLIDAETVGVWADAETVGVLAGITTVAAVGTIALSVIAFLGRLKRDSPASYLEFFPPPEVRTAVGIFDAPASLSFDRAGGDETFCVSAAGDGFKGSTPAGVVASADAARPMANKATMEAVKDLRIDVSLDVFSAAGRTWLTPNSSMGRV
jgi:hypothetical protein